MGQVKIRHYVVKAGGRAYWQPSAHAKKLGWKPIPLGVDGLTAWTAAEQINQQWDTARKAKSAGTKAASYAPGTLGAVYDTYRETTVWAKKAKVTQAEWAYAWETIGVVFGDVRVANISAFPDCDQFYQTLRTQFTLNKCYKIFKVFRAMLNVAVSMKLIPSNPSNIVRNEMPAGRSHTWGEDEILALIAEAERQDLAGLALVIRIAYDTQLSPVDVRTLSLDRFKTDASGICYFETRRAKTKRRAFATITIETHKAMQAYLAACPFTVPSNEPFIRTRMGTEYGKDTLTEHFRRARSALFPGDKRSLCDLRRTGIVELALGGATPTELSAKAANNIVSSGRLHDVYNPTQLAAVMAADEKRAIGRAKLRGTK